MSCGLGAVALIFILLKPGEGDGNSGGGASSLSIQTSLQELEQGRENLVALQNTIDDVNDELAEAEGLAIKIEKDITKLRASIDTIDPNHEDKIKALKAQLVALEEQFQQLKEEEQRNSKAASYAGEGQRQYLTGLKLGGHQILILLDSSASMLDNSVINIIRRRIGSDQQKRYAPKWQKALQTTRWIMANLPLEADYQLLHFNQDTYSADNKPLNQWYAVSDSLQVESHLNFVERQIPDKGTNFKKAIEAAMDMNPKPDNIFIITDGLPTLGGKRERNTISGKQRLRLFEQATNLLDPEIPINAILLPLEGDYLAAGAFWKLAIESHGAFITPTDDWP